MKMTMTDGTVFEGSMAEYAELLAFAKTQQAEESAVKAESKPRPFAEGDIVVITANTNDSCNTVGDIGKVEEVDAGDAKIIVPGKARRGGLYTIFEELRLATEEEIAKHRESEKWTKIGRKPGEFKKGDLVYVELSDGSVLYNEVVGINTTYSDLRYYVKGKKYGISTEKPEDLNLLAPVESLVNAIPID